MSELNAARVAAINSLWAVRWCLGMSREGIYDLLGSNALWHSCRTGRISTDLEDALWERLGIPAWMIHLGPTEVLALGLHLDIPDSVTVSPEQSRRIRETHVRTNYVTVRELEEASSAMFALGLTPTQTYVFAIGYAQGGFEGANTLLHLYEMMYDD